MKTNIIQRAAGLVLALCLAASAVACTGGQSTSETPGPAEGLFTAGTYTGTGTGMNGDILVEVIFSTDAITAVTVGEHAETDGISDPAIAQVPGAIVDAQSTQVDTVAGATLTSNGIISAVENAIRQAGADPADLVPKSAGTGEAENISLQADVVVVGGGLAGLSAAIRANQAGASVILVEKMGVLGGSSALSGGGLGATNTTVQQEYGIEDSAESWKELWEARQATSPGDSGYPDWARVDALIDEAPVTIDWLLELDYTFRRPEGFGVDPVERLHFPEEGSGAALTGFLGEKAAGLGIEILTETRATELVTNGSGAVVGVLAEGKNHQVEISAGAVVLASGGFAHSEELTARFTPEVVDFIDYGAAAAGNTGDGIVMAETVGAIPYENPWLIGLGLRSPVAAMNGFYWYGNFIFVNAEGSRFTNEAEHYAIVYNDAVYEAPEGAYMVFDSGEGFAAYAAAAEENLGDAAVYSGETVEELAAAMGADPDTLASTLAAYGNGSDEFGKAAQLCTPIATGPFYAVEFYPCNMGTFGGVKVDDLGAVLDANGNVIPGLYAAGEMANRPYYNQVYMSGSALQVAATTGRLAGEAAAEFAG